MRTVTVSNTAPPPTGGLVAGYAFDASAGTTAADASGSGITGTLANGAGWAGGKYGNAVALAGDDDVVSLGNPTGAAAHRQHDDQRLDQLGRLPGRRRGRGVQARARAASSSTPRSTPGRGSSASS